MSSSTQPDFRKVDISSIPAVLAVATTLRRLWHVDPASPALGEELRKVQEESNHEGDSEGDYLDQILALLLYPAIRNQIGEEADPNNDVYDDAKWMATADPKVLIDPPTGFGGPLPPPLGLDPHDVRPARPFFTPFRRRVYAMHRDVFYQAYCSLKAAEPRPKIETFEPPARPGAPKGTVFSHRPHEGTLYDGNPYEFEADTFVYPIWIAKGTKLAIKKDGHTETMVELGDESQKWTEVLWFKGGSKIVYCPESEDRTVKGAVAVIVSDVCQTIDAVENQGLRGDVDVARVGWKLGVYPSLRLA